MKQVTVTLEEKDSLVIDESLSEMGVTFDQWVEKKIADAIKVQRTANLQKVLRRFARTAKTLIRWDDKESLESVVIKLSIGGKVEEFGGLGKFYKLCNSFDLDYLIPTERIHTAIKVVNAADVAKQLNKSTQAV